MPPIPGFLELGGYLRRYRRAMRWRLDELPTDLTQRVDGYQTLEDVRRQERTFIHGDCKINNLLFQAQQDRVLGVIDLDTVGPGHWAGTWYLVRLWPPAMVVCMDQFRACVRGFPRAAVTWIRR